MGRLASGMRGAMLVLCLLAAACSPVYRKHGYVPLDADLEEIVVGTSTQQDVATMVGRPASQGLLTDGGWYYVGSRFRSYGALPDAEIDRQVVAISFDAGGVVENVERFGLERGRIVVLSRRVTDSNIKGVGFLRQLLGNIGRVSAGQLID